MTRQEERAVAELRRRVALLDADRHTLVVSREDVAALLVAVEDLERMRLFVEGGREVVA